MTLVRYDMEDSPVGRLRLLASADALVGVYLPAQVERGQPPAAVGGSSAILEAAVSQLREYFAGTRVSFELPLATPGATLFQQRVWAALRTIPYGARWSYGQLAGALASPKAVRAVGGANALNPLSIVVPCHRVVGASGALTGYAGGVGAKAWLLAHECPPDRG